MHDRTFNKSPRDSRGVMQNDLMDHRGARGLKRMTLLALCALRLPALQPTFTRYTADSGLPQQQVTAVARDRDGYLWIGTQTSGLVRYDGAGWRIRDASDGLPSSTVNCITADGEGTLYAGMSGGIVRLELPDRWVTIHASPDTLTTGISTLITGSGGELLFGTLGGLFRLNPGAPARRLADLEVLSMAPARGGAWIGTDQGIYRLEPGTDVPVRLADSPPQRTRALLAHADGSLWAVFSGDGLRVRTAEGWTTPPAGRVLGEFVRELKPGRDGATAWVSTSDRGLFHGSLKAGFTAVGDMERLGTALVYGVLEDEEDCLWLATDYGLIKRTGTAFGSYGLPEGINPAEGYFGFVQGADGRVWVAGEKGLHVLGADDRWRKLPNAPAFANALIYDVTITPDGTVWAATTLGLGRLRGERLEPVAVPGYPKISLASVQGLADGTLALGSSRWGVLLYKNSRVIRARAPANGPVNNLTLGRDGRLLVAGRGWGVATVSPEGEAIALVDPARLPSATIQYVAEDRRGRMWLATERGAVMIAPQAQPVLYDRARGLPDNYTYWVGEDARGAIWFGTNRGIALLDRDGSLALFNRHDGLPADECNDDGFMLASDGRVFISSAGIARFLGRPDGTRFAPVRISLEQFTVAGGPLDPRLEHSLERGPGPLAFRFTAATYRDEARVVYRYRIDGLEKDWNRAPPGVREARYGSIGPGTYAFQVVARASDGRESAPAVVRFTIRRAWWETRAAWALAAVLLLSLAWAGVVWRTRVQAAHGRRLAALVEERTAELERLNGRLARMAVTDELTGLPNRRHLLERLGEAFAAARRRGQPLALLMADLDHFKRVNDRLGHATGDEVLRAAAAAMRESLREFDIVGRWGGEEFLVIFPGETPEGARVAAERLRLRVESALAAHPLLAGQPLKTTLSGGLVALDSSIDTAAGFIQRADQALYAAKAAGRNCIQAG